MRYDVHLVPKGEIIANIYVHLVPEGEIIANIYDRETDEYVVAVYTGTSPEFVRDALESARPQQIEVPMPIWPRCKNCGHTAQQHNHDTGEAPANYGSDFNKLCLAYQFPDTFPVEEQLILLSRRQAALGG